MSGAQTELRMIENAAGIIGLRLRGVKVPSEFDGFTNQQLAASICQTAVALHARFVEDGES